jgi:hypothetical protein
MRTWLGSLFQKEIKKAVFVIGGYLCQNSHRQIDLGEYLLPWYYRTEWNIMSKKFKEQTLHHQRDHLEPFHTQTVQGKNGEAIIIF